MYKVDPNSFFAIPQSITMGDVGTLGNDGKRWILLKDNDERDVTPIVSGMNYYTFGAAAQKYKLTIAARGNCKNYDDLSAINPEFCVGQLLTFIAQWDPNPSAMDTVIRWHLPGKYVNQVFNYSLSCTTYIKNDDLLTNGTAECWYVRDPGGACSVRETLHFANGQYVNVAAAGSFSIYCPHFTDFSTVDPLFPNSPRSFGWDGNLLYYGNPQTDEHEQYWEVSVTSKYDGTMGILQLVNGEYVQNYGLLPIPSFYTFDTGGFDWLDGNSEQYEESPYIGTQAGPHIIALTDKPSADLNDVFPYNIHMQGHFTDYLRFRPSCDGSIFITLGQNDWSMEGLGSLWLGLLTNDTPVPSDLGPSEQFPLWRDWKAE